VDLKLKVVKCKPLFLEKLSLNAALNDTCYVKV